MSELRPIFSEPGCTLALDKERLWLYLNDRKWAMRQPGGALYRWANRVEQYRKELGFYVPRVLLVYPITFEVKLDSSYSTWTYDNKNRQRMLVTDPLIFISTARLSWVGKAEHKVKRKP